MSSGGLPTLAKSPIVSAHNFYPDPSETNTHSLASPVPNSFIIMKLAFAAALLVGSTAATISPDGGPTDQGIHSVGVYCKGLELEALSAKALSYTAKALEETFNSVHTAKDGATAHVVANGPMGAVAATNSLRGGVTVGFEGAAKSVFIGPNQCASCNPRSNLRHCFDRSLRDLVSQWLVDGTAAFAAATTLR